MTIMAEDIKYQINVQMADNAVTRDNPDDKIFTIVSQGTADKERVIAEMMAVNPGLEKETLRHVLELENRIVKKLILSGMRVNNGLYEATPQCKGVVTGTAWDAEKNSIYVHFQQGKELREAIRATTINVVGEKGSSFYLSNSLDAASGKDGFNATVGSNLTITGKNIKVAGDDPSVGITLTNAARAVTTIKPGKVGMNMPSKLMISLPDDLAAGDYTLTITTQFSGSSSFLKAPRSITQTIHVVTDSSGDSESPGEI